MTSATGSPENAELIARIDWAQTPLGDAGQWPPALRTVLQLVLNNRFPMVFWWGPQFVQFYNDQYTPMLGEKHPRSMGQGAQACWEEIWDVIGPQVTSVYAGGPSTWNEDLLLDINRHGFVEETYFTFSYSALPDPEAPGGIGGVLGTVQETSQKVIGERRMQLLRDLAERSTEARTVEEECTLAAETLERYPKPVPFCAIYLIADDRKTAKLAAAAGLEQGSAAAPLEIDLTDPHARPWPLFHAAQTARLEVVGDLQARLNPVPSGPWANPPQQAVIVPIQSTAAHQLAGFLVAGVNPRVRLDARYVDFYNLVAAQIGNALSHARAYEEERGRAEALAELDRAKNVFFSNVSHEFRTPLTLMLGPLSELQKNADTASRHLVETARRNSLRLLKLVNTLLEFSRLEVGRNDAAFAETDLATLTRELCGIFESAIESAGLSFRTDITLEDPVYVDRSMWEKIVLNLISNAIKFTLEGEIRVSLRKCGNAAELVVADTGVGVPPGEVPHLFERFRRVRGAKSRSHEGSGIGLALVKELVDLHGGTIGVSSTIGDGTTFRIAIPLGTAHLDPERLVREESAEAHASSAIEQYLADVESTITRADVSISSPPASAATGRPRILLADDNGDLREYVAGLLSGANEVTAVANGAQALEAAHRERFDVIVSDVMMPEMDGLELLRAIRSDPQLSGTPFIFLSARAGEEAAVEGLGQGADDYIVKPFSADELQARVAAHVSAASIRERGIRDLRQSEERFRTLTASMPHVVIEANGDGEITYLSDAFSEYTGLTVDSAYGEAWVAVLHPDDVKDAVADWQRAVQGGVPFMHDFRMRRADGVYRWFTARALPQRDRWGRIVRWTGTGVDIDDARRLASERGFLADAGRILAESLGLEQTLQSIAALCVPEFADWCQIDLRTPDDKIRTVAVVHRDRAKNRIAQQLAGRVHLNRDAEAGAPYVIRTGTSQIISDVPEHVSRQAIGDDEEYRIYDQLGMRSVVCVPLIGRGRTVGSIGLLYGDSGRTYAPEDLPVLEELGRRAGSAVENAREFEREHRVAESFQEASLPPTLPDVPGVTFDAIYVPGSAEAQVGGDWYDAMRLLDGRVVISIGDVAGSGLHAAVTMGNMRQIIRGIAQVHADPALMLDAADRALRLEHPEQFVTAFVGVMDPIAKTFAYASAGHPPAMLRHPDGRIEPLSDGGLPLGLRFGQGESRGRSIALPDGACLVLYTDGLTESTRNSEEGERRLIESLYDSTVCDAERPAETLMQQLLDGGTAHDDVAILVANIAGIPASAGGALQRWNFDASDARAAAAARREFRNEFAARGGSFDDVSGAELVLGELIGNAVRYAPGPLEITVDWSGTAPVLHVLDDGPGFRHIAILPPDLFSESGRGLYIVSSLTQDFHVSKRPGGGSHARAVLRVESRQISGNGHAARSANLLGLLVGNG